MPVANPTLLMLAVVVSDELQVSSVVRSCVLPSENMPVAVNCSDTPDVIVGLTGVTTTDAGILFAGVVTASVAGVATKSWSLTAPLPVNVTVLLAGVKM